jgi:predicted porin
MKIKALALAIAAVTTAPAAFAQSNVTVYGLVDVGYMHQDVGTGGKNSISNETGSGASHLGFKGTEDLGNGMKADFQLEMQLVVDSGALGGTVFRQSWVGLGGGFGHVTLGRDYSPTFLAAYRGEPCGWCGMGSYAGLTGQGLRNSNMIKYDSPNFGGFSFALAHSAGEQVGSSVGNTNEGGVYYAGGPVNVAYAYREVKNSATVTQKGQYLGANVGFGIAKIYALLGTEKTNTSSVNQRYYGLGLGLNLGGGNLNFTYMKLKDKTASNKDTNFGAVAYFYPLSKRTQVYAQYAQVNNDSAATNNVYVGSDGLTPAAGQDPKMYTVGLRHSF